MGTEVDEHLAQEDRDHDEEELLRRDYEDRWDNPLKDEEDRNIPGNVGNSPYGDATSVDGNSAEGADDEDSEDDDDQDGGDEDSEDHEEDDHDADGDY